MLIYLWGFVLISIHPAVTIFEVITTYVYPLPTRIVPDPVVANYWTEERIKSLYITFDGFPIDGIYRSEAEQTAFRRKPSLNRILTSMDTIDSTINRQFSHLSAYRLYQNASIWANMVQEIWFHFKLHPFQYTQDPKELQYYTVESTYLTSIQLNEAIKETLSVFAQLDFNEERFMILALDNEHITLLSLVDNPDTLDVFIKNSSYELQRDFNWMSKDKEFYSTTRYKRLRI